MRRTIATPAPDWSQVGSGLLFTHPWGTSNQDFHHRSLYSHKQIQAKNDSMVFLTAIHACSMGDAWCPFPAMEGKFRNRLMGL